MFNGRAKRKETFGQRRRPEKGLKRKDEKRSHGYLLDGALKMELVDGQFMIVELTCGLTTYAQVNTPLLKHTCDMS